MGRKSKQKGDGGNRNGGQAKRFNRHQGYESIRKENAKLERLYNTVINFPDEAQREAFWAAFRRELPNSFRFAGSRGHALAVKKLLQTRYIPQITQITHLDGQPVTPPEPVPWYPDELAWWMTTPKNVVRKYPPFKAFQKFLVSETSVGNISRQEVVSMIPPLLLDVQPGMAVLDMCAAPGSKAAQLIEMLHRGEEVSVRKALQAHSTGNAMDGASNPGEDSGVHQQDGRYDDGRATGLLIANDNEYKRCHLLVHQLKRLSSPNMIVTNHDATLYPSLRLPSDDPKAPRWLKFDRILADVPCSGDGTLRKNATLWNEWTPGSPLGLYITQVRILVRALQMLKPGGRAVYSTCSMNPVENEAVIVSAIERCGGPDKIEIVDCSKELPGLKREPGMREWQIMDRAGRLWSNWEDIEAFTKAAADGQGPGRVSKSMLPRTGDEGMDLPLENCMRVYPHLQDTGAFFIAVLHKKTEFKAKPEAPPKKAHQPPNHARNGGAKTEHHEAKMDTELESTDANIGGRSPKRARNEDREEAGSPQKKLKTDEGEEKHDEPVEDVFEATADKMDQDKAVEVKITDVLGRKKKPLGPMDEPFVFLDPDHHAIKDVQRFYDISPRFPSDRYMVRNATGEPAKAFYYTSARVRDVLLANDGRGIKFVHGGVRMFVKQDAPSASVCRWRIQCEGLPILQGYVGPGRVVMLRSRETLRKLLIEMFPKFADGEWASLGEIGERVRDIGLGCCVLRLAPEEGDETMEAMALPLWKSFHSVNLMLPKEDRAAMLLRIFNDTSPLVNERDKLNGLKTGPRDMEGKAMTETAEGEDVEAGEAMEEDANVGEAIEADEDGENGQGEDSHVTEVAGGC